MKTGNAIIDESYRSFLALALMEAQRQDLRQSATLILLIRTLVLAGFLQTELADITGMSKTTIGRWHDGQKGELLRSPVARRAISQLLITHLKSRLDALS